MISIIPARGGSKGVPGKNIKDLCGKPLISYTIEAAINADCIDRVIVSTDDEQIANVSKEYGAEVPFLRPKEFSGDSASAIDVYLHAVDFLSEENPIDTFMVLLPTSPMRTSRHIEEAYKFFLDTNATTLISTKEIDTPPAWFYTVDNNYRMTNAGLGSDEMDNRQVHKSYVRPNGAIYILNYDLLKNKRTYYCDNTVSYKMDEMDSVDIDTLSDFKMAELLMTTKEYNI